MTLRRFVRLPTAGSHDASVKRAAVREVGALQFARGVDKRTLVPSWNPRYARSKAMILTRTAVIMSISAVGKLAKLLADEGRIDEKIRDTQAALALVQKRVSELLAQHYIAVKEPRVQIPEDLMKEEESFERLLQALKDMKGEIAKQIRPVEEQIIQANVDYLCHTFNQQTHELNRCLEKIDEHLLACRETLQHYERIRSNLHGLNEKLTQLNAENIQIPDSLPTSDLGEIIKQRIEILKSQGKM
jgi:chromosome segregation ATPase